MKIKWRIGGMSVKGFIGLTREGQVYPHDVDKGIAEDLIAQGIAVAARGKSATEAAPEAPEPTERNLEALDNQELASILIEEHDDNPPDKLTKAQLIKRIKEKGGK